MPAKDDSSNTNNFPLCFFWMFLGLHSINPLRQVGQCSFPHGRDGLTEVHTGKEA